MFLDLKLGLLWAIAVGTAFGVTLLPWWFVAGIVFALLPDLDFLVELWQRGTVGGKTIGAHRTLLHNPIPYIPAVIILGVVAGPAWMVLATLGIFGHFVHDSMGMGFGVRWLWPFSPNWFKIFSDREGNIVYDQAHFRPLVWTPEEMKKVVAEKGNDNWIREDLAYHRARWKPIALRLFASALFAALLVYLLPY